MTAQQPARLNHTGHLIRRAQQLHAALWNREVSVDISSVQYAALAVLEREAWINQRQLGDALGLDRSTIADLVERMQKNGLVQRQRSPEDGRQKILALTDQGQDTLNQLGPRVAEVERHLTGGLGKAERDALQAALRAMLADAVAQGVLGGGSLDVAP